jgi:hypothetical protein
MRYSLILERILLKQDAKPRHTPEDAGITAQRKDAPWSTTTTTRFAQMTWLG